MTGTMTHDEELVMLRRRVDAMCAVPLTAVGSLEHLVERQADLAFSLGRAVSYGDGAVSYRELFNAYGDAIARYFAAWRAEHQKQHFAERNRPEVTEWPVIRTPDRYSPGWPQA